MNLLYSFLVNFIFFFYLSSLVSNFPTERCFQKTFMRILSGAAQLLSLTQGLASVLSMTACRSVLREQACRLLVKNYNIGSYQLHTHVFVYSFDKY